MIETIVKYRKLEADISKLIADSKYKSSHFIKELGLTQSTFYRKANTGKFTSDEIMKIVQLVAPEEYYKWKFEEEIRLAEEQIANGNYHTNEEVIARIKKKIASEN